mmetsp:Transcript_94433/g.137886  ORF Transcript_94433/g.137886 Transcript_94433/m.137886 type:complete len:240 (-) Transcript_94433:41-760(-)
MHHIACFQQTAGQCSYGMRLGKHHSLETQLLENAISKDQLRKLGAQRIKYAIKQVDAGILVDRTRQAHQHQLRLCKNNDVIIRVVQRGTLNFLAQERVAAPDRVAALGQQVGHHLLAVRALECAQVHCGIKRQPKNDIFAQSCACQEVDHLRTVGHLSIHQQDALLAWHVAGERMEQTRLAMPRAAHHPHKLALAHIQRDRVTILAKGVARRGVFLVTSPLKNTLFGLYRHSLRQLLFG